MIEGVTGVILTGGASRRMGRPKWKLEIAGRSILSVVIERMQSLFPSIILVRNQKQNINYPGVKVTEDDKRFPRGALRGIYAGLQTAQTPWIFVAGCDMPFIQAKVVYYLHAQAWGYQGVVPVLSDGPHPLHSLYHRDLLPAVEHRLQTNSMKIMSIFEGYKLREVGEDEFVKNGLARVSFFNINTPAQYQQALSMLQRRKDHGRDQGVNHI